MFYSELGLKKKQAIHLTFLRNVLVPADFFCFISPVESFIIIQCHPKEKNRSQKQAPAAFKRIVVTANSEEQRAKSEARTPVGLSELVNQYLPLAYL